MSRSMKSGGSSRGRDTAQIKERIRELLYSVKEERQHLENRLHENDVYIEQLREEYQLAVRRCRYSSMIMISRTLMPKKR